MLHSGGFFFFLVQYFKLWPVFYTSSMFQRGLTNLSVLISSEWSVAVMLYCTEKGRKDESNTLKVVRSMDCIVHGIAKSRIQLGDFHTYIHFYILLGFFFSLNTIIWRLFLNSISVCICLCMCASMLVAICVSSFKFNKYLLMTYCVNMCKALGFYQ